MASSVRKSPYAFPAEIARFLAVEDKDVTRMIKLDKLPHTKVPEQTRNVFRIYLPDSHRWLITRSDGARDALCDYPDFLAQFDNSVRIDRAKKPTPAPES